MLDRPEPVQWRAFPCAHAPRYKAGHRRRLGKTLPTRLLLGLLLVTTTARCTSGNLCDESHPCGGNWQCLDGEGRLADSGQCGRLTTFPGICVSGAQGDSGYCTLECPLDSASDSDWDGICPEPFYSCDYKGLFSDSGTEYVCIPYDSFDPDLEPCGSSADCSGFQSIEWME